MGEKKVWWNSYVEVNVKEYLNKKKGLSASQCIHNYYDFVKSQEITELQQKEKNLQNDLSKVRAELTKRENDLTKQQEFLSNDKIGQIVKSWTIPDVMIGKYIDHPTNQGEKILIDKELILKYKPDYQFKKEE